MAAALVPSSNSQQTFTFSNVVMDVDVGTGSDRMIRVTLFTRGQSATITSATYAGVDLTHIERRVHASASPQLTVDHFYLLNPSSGTNSVEITFADPTNRLFACYADAYTGIDQVDALDDWGSAEGTSTTPQLDLDPTTDNQLLACGMIHEGALASTVGAGETALVVTDHGAWNAGTSYVVQTAATLQTLDWTNSASDHWVIVGASFKESAVSNDPPTPSLVTADDAELSQTPTLTFVATDPDSDDVEYQIQISNDPSFAQADGPNLTDSNTGTGVVVHPQPVSGGVLTHTGFFQVDDRPGQSFTAVGGVLERVVVPLGDFAASGGTYSPSGTMYVRIYDIDGTHGTDATPADPAARADTPTLNWLAVSDGVPLSPSSIEGDYDFIFSGANRLELTPGTHYMWVLDWDADSGAISNTFGVEGDTGLNHDGNSYIDGDSANNGVTPGWDMNFELYEEFSVRDNLSSTDAGFINTINGGDTSPFNSAENVSFTVQPADILLPNIVYYWRVRARDPSGSAQWSDWTSSRSFTTTESSTIPINIGSTLSFAGTQTRQTSKGLTGSLSFLGLLLNQIRTSFNGTLGFAGSLSPTSTLSKILSGDLSFVGNNVRRTSKNFVGSLSLSGSFSPTSVFTQLLSGSISFAGDVSSRAGKSVQGVLLLAGTLQKHIGIDTEGSLSWTGAIRRLTSVNVTGSLSWDAAVDAIRTFLKEIGGSLGPSGSLQRQIGKGLTGSISFTSQINYSVSKLLEGALTFVGTALRTFVPDLGSVTPVQLTLQDRALTLVVGKRSFTLKLKGRNS